MKKCDSFAAFLENDASKQRVRGWLEAGVLPHALFITAEDGCGRNFFARLIAQAYLGDGNSLVVRDIHPDCFTITGEGASGAIPVRRIREVSYELNMAAAMTDGRRVAILRDVRNMSKSAANALLKILEEPPKGVVFILTASGADDVLDTIRSRCVTVPLLPLSVPACCAAVTRTYPDYSQERIQNLCALYNGRLGCVLDALAAPERLALTDCAQRFCDAALSRDKLLMASALEGAANRGDMKHLLFDCSMCLKRMLKGDTNHSGRIAETAHAVFQAMRDIEKYVNIKLLATHLVAQL